MGGCLFLGSDAEQIASIRDFYGLDEARMPLEEQLLTRSAADVATPKRLYFIGAGGPTSQARLPCLPLPPRSGRAPCVGCLEILILAPKKV